MGEVAVPPSSIGHDIVGIRRVFRDDSVVDDATLLVQQDGESRAVRGQGGERRGCKPFEEICCSCTPEACGTSGLCRTVSEECPLTLSGPYVQRRTTRRYSGYGDGLQLPSVKSHEN